jgi:hypothetical protein
MDSKTLIKALKIAVREVIKEELTEILQEGLQSTITEMKQSSAIQEQTQRNSISVKPAVKKSKVQFTDNKWASILNETEALVEQGPAGSSFSELVNEGMDEIRMSAKDAVGFGQMRENMKAAITGQSVAPSVMEDPETGKVYDVAPEVQQALTRDYSALVKAMNKKRG